LTFLKCQKFAGLNLLSAIVHQTCVFRQSERLLSFTQKCLSRIKIILLVCLPSKADKISCYSCQILKLFLIIVFLITVGKYYNSSLFDEFVCKLGLFWHVWAHECQKRPNLHTNELNTTFFCSTSPLKAPNCLKPLKLA
jgi:hypothetical protein